MKPIKQTVYLPVKLEEHSNYHIFDLHECGGSHLKTVAEGYGYFFTSEQLNEYTQNVIKQALETAAENAKDMWLRKSFIDKQSITNAFEETFKKFEL